MASQQPDKASARTSLAPCLAMGGERDEKEEDPVYVADGKGGLKTMNWDDLMDDQTLAYVDAMEDADEGGEGEGEEEGVAYGEAGKMPRESTDKRFKPY